MSGTINRKERIIARLGEIMYDLSGIEMDEFDDSTTFLEMGMDSLFLTQVSTALQGEFGIKIKFRQLIEEVDTLDLQGFGLIYLNHLCKRLRSMRLGPSWLETC